jgi:hypothetical protein
VADTKEEVLELGQARLVATTIRFSLGLVWDYGARPPETKAVTGHRTPKGSSGLTEEQACFRGNDSMESFSTKERRERAIKAATNIVAA